TTENQRSVIAVRKAVEHSDGALGSAIAWIGAVRGKRDCFQVPQLARRGLDKHPDFPMAGVITQRDRLAVRCAEPALRAQDQKLLSSQFTRVPTHPGVLRPAKDIAAGRFGKHLRSERKLACRAVRFGPDVVDLRRTGEIVWHVTMVI